MIMPLVIKALCKGGHEQHNIDYMEQYGSWITVPILITIQQEDVLKHSIIDTKNPISLKRVEFTILVIKVDLYVVST